MIDTNTISSMTADIEAFRQKVIDAGIQSRLTEQLPEDGTAQELFERIQEEKARLVKEGKIKKQKPLPPIKPEEIPFEIPENWMWVRFENISYIVRGGSPRPIKRYITNDPDGINWIKIGDVEKGGKYIYSAKEKIIPEGEKRSRHVYPGDFLLTNSMSFGRPYISRIEGCIHDGWLLIRNLGGFNVDYLYYLLSSGFLYDQFIEKASGSTVDNLNIEKVNSSLIPFPPLAEQQRIAERIEEILSVQQDLQTSLENYTSDISALKSKVIDAGIQGRLTEQLPEDGTAQELFERIQEEKARLVKEGKIKKQKPLPPIKLEEIPFEIPGNWMWVRWGNVINIVSAKRVHQSDWKKEGIPFYRAREIAKLADEGFVKNDLFISEELYNKFSESGVPHEDDLMVSAVGTLGKTYVVKSNDKFYYKDASVLCFENYMHLNPFFMKYLMESDLMRTQISSNSGGTTVDTLTMVRMIQYLFPLPPLAEQKRIAERIEEILEAIGE